MLRSSDSHALSVMKNMLTNVHPLTTGLHTVKETPFTMIELYPSLTRLHQHPGPWKIQFTRKPAAVCCVLGPAASTGPGPWFQILWELNDSILLDRTKYPLTLLQVKVKVKIKIQRHAAVISISSVFHSRFKICFFFCPMGFTKTQLNQDADCSLFLRHHLMPNLYACLGNVTTFRQSHFFPPKNE